MIDMAKPDYPEDEKIYADLLNAKNIHITKMFS